MQQPHISRRGRAAAVAAASRPSRCFAHADASECKPRGAGRLPSCALLGLEKKWSKVHSSSPSPTRLASAARASHPATSIGNIQWRDILPSAAKTSDDGIGTASGSSER